MKKLALFYIAFALILPGCGKKKEEKARKTESVQIESLFSKANTNKKEIPIYTAENEPLIDDEIVSDFAFVDEDDTIFFEKTEDKSKSLADADNINNTDNAVNTDAIDTVVAITDGMPSAQDTSDEELIASIDLEEEYEFDNVQFEFNRNSIKTGQKKAIKRDIEIAKKAIEKGKNVIIDGHTCQMGSASYNLALSLKRANAVKKEMVENGISEDNIKTVGKGYESPLVWTDKAQREERIAELSPNRRAEINIS